VRPTRSTAAGAPSTTPATGDGPCPAPRSPDDRSAAYLETTDLVNVEQTAASFSVDEVTRGALRLRGPCPRCGDAIEVPVGRPDGRGAHCTLHSANRGDQVEQPGGHTARHGFAAYWYGWPPGR
jgi:hypothetical protein